MKRHSLLSLASVRTLVLSGLVLLAADMGLAVLPPAKAPLPNLDKRQKPGPPPGALSPDQAAAVAELRAQLPNLKVDFEPVTGSPRSVSATEGFLSGQSGQGKSISAGSLASFAAEDPYRMTKAFLKDHARLFGFGPEALGQARISREFVTPHNGLRTVVWEQQVDGIAVFEAVLISHTTSKSELVNLSSQFVPDLQAAASRGVANRAALLAAPTVTAPQAVALAAQNVGVELKAAGVTAVADPQAASAEQRRQFTAPGLKGKAETKLTWLPMNRNTLRLCWDVILMSRARGEMFRVLVDVQTGEPLLRHCLTDYLTDASYRVFTSDSPSPFSPGLATPASTQPSLVARTLVTLSALDTNASPAGWINDGGNETLGNNVDAHTDWGSSDQPDLPRPQGSPFRVFDFPMDLGTQDPTSYAPAAVVQLFYLNNWMHDRLYELGFTEAAGNFQSNNFGRGGLGNDAVMADAQDGVILPMPNCDNANFSTPPDGLAPRMQMYVFCTPSPRRDGDLDAEVVLHEYTHGLSNRRVGGGVGISAMQSEGMGEGWSDFYALSLLSEAGDDVNGNYAAGAYASHQIGGSSDLQNYYFGIRRYPYTTDMSKNPLTFKDLDPAQADYCSSGAPYHTGMFGACSVSLANEVHNQGELWCVTLWEARANLINRYGWAIGNQLILQLVTDGMNLSPVNPTFLQARDAILQADLVDNGGANRNELWAAFAKRGMGFSATSPASSTTTGVQEAYDLPDDLQITPASGFTGSGPVGGPFSPSSISFILTNTGGSAFSWTGVNTAAWLDVLLTDGTLTPGGEAATVSANLNTSANSLPMGIYTGTVWFTNLSSQRAQSRRFTLRVGQPDYFTELFDTSANNLAFQTFTFTPDGSGSFYSVCRTAATTFPTDPAGGTVVPLGDDTNASLTLSGTDTVAIYSTRTNVLFIGSNGYLTMNTGDWNMVESLASHFNRPRISVLFHDLNPETGGSVSWRQLSDRVAVTYSDVCEYGTTLPNSFQIELFFDGRIRLTYLTINCVFNLVGLSAGQGVPANFTESEFSGYPLCPPPDALAVNPDAGFASQGYQGGPFTPSSTTYTLSNAGPTTISWTVTHNQGWLSVSPANGTLAANQSASVAAVLTALADALPAGPPPQTDSLVFSNLTTTAAQQRGIRLNILPPVLAITNAGATLLAENCGAGNGAIDPGETVTLNLGLANIGNVTAPNMVATLLPTGGVTAPSGPQSYGTLLPGGAAVSNAFSLTATGTCGGTLVATLQLQSGTNDLGTASFSFRLGVSGAVFAENFDGVTAPNLPPGWTASLSGAGTPWATTTAQRDTAPNAVYAPDPGSSSENWLTSPSFFLPATGAQLSFRHAYSTESCCDAGWLQISIAGGAFTDILTAGGSFATNGYSGMIGWRGTSTGYPGFITTIANLPVSAANQNIQLRWRFTSDVSVSGLGWYLDSVLVGNGYTCCVDPNTPTHFTWDTIASPQCANVPLRVTLRARNDSNGVATNFTGVMALSGLACTVESSNPVPVIPAVSGTFAQGVWAGAITVPQLASNVVLRADDGVRPTAFANPIDVVGMPQLGIERYGNIMLMLWPAWPAGSPSFELETATRLAPDAWVPAAYPPLQIGDAYVVPVDTTEPRSFYRLRHTGH